MQKNIPRSVDTPTYHVWTDALHARSLAKETSDKWDRGAYVRWAILSAWTAFESASAEALNVQGLGNRFKDNLDAAIQAQNLKKIDWGKGNWQKILEINQKRTDYIHLLLPQARLFPAVKEADDAIRLLRFGVKDVFGRAGKPIPAWVNADETPGWKVSGGFTVTAHATLVKAGAYEDDPKVIKVAYVYRDQEHVTDLLPPGSDPKPYVDRLIEEISVPISCVRTYRGIDLIEEIVTNSWRS